MSWIHTFCKKRFDYLRMREEDITIYDIAQALSNVCRYGGHCSFYSVAEHSLNVSHIVPEKFALEALMHDATEAYLGDLPRPLKRLIPEYRRIERELDSVIRKKFKIQQEHSQQVKIADDVMLATEASRFGYDIEEWNIGQLPRDDIRIDHLDPSQAKNRFLRRFHELCGENW